MSRNNASAPHAPDMTGSDVEAIRQAIERALGMRITLRRLGVALGLAPDRAGDTVRKWIASGPTGPAATALRLFAIAARDLSLGDLGMLGGDVIRQGEMHMTSAPRDAPGEVARICRAMLLEHVRGLLGADDHVADPPQ